MKERDGGNLNGDFVLLREAVVEAEDVETDNECRADECETPVWE